MFASIGHPVPRHNFSMPFALAPDPSTRVWMMSAIFLLASSLLLIGPLMFDERLLNGVNIWSKPLKFALSISLHCATIAILIQRLKPQIRKGYLFVAGSYVSVAFLLGEAIYIGYQASQARASHFNSDTPFETLMYAAMGIAITSVMLFNILIGFLIWFKGDNHQPGLQAGAAIGLIWGCILTIIFAGYMSGNGSHFIGGHSSVSLPILGWSREIGDLRPPHFVATHLIQVMPLIGWLMDKWQKPHKLVLALTSAAFTGLATWFFSLALNAQPIFPIG